MPWIPPEPGAVPTLGYGVIDWIEAYLDAPDQLDGRALKLYGEQEDFVLRYYEIDPLTGARKYRRGVLSRPRGWGKSPFAAALCLAEALGPVMPAGWDAHGQPVAVPWSAIRTPEVYIAATSEEQTRYTWSALLEMIGDTLINAYPGLEPLDTFVNLPWRGLIKYITSSGRSAKGARGVFTVMDQTEQWLESNGGHDLAEKVRNNAAKVDGHTLETPNAFKPNEDSIAERSSRYWREIREGRARDEGLYFDHREAPADTDLRDRESLLKGLAAAYGDSAQAAGGHVNLDRLVLEIWDPNTDPQVARADFLNQITHASDAWMTESEWIGRSRSWILAAGLPAPEPIREGDVIALGFDGSRSRARGITDATALVGCRISDGYVFTIRVWEQPEGALGIGWRVPTLEVDQTVDEVFSRYRVVAFYADPARWESFIAGWEAKYGAQLPVKATRTNPIEWWMTGGRSALVVRALEQFRAAVLSGDLSHDGSTVLTAHVLNARNRRSRSGLQIAKDHPESPRKIDAAVAAVLAYQARLDALSNPAVMNPPAPTYAARRIQMR